MSIGSAALARQLTAFGLDPQHKHDTAIRSELATSRDFWRGVVDGDGSVKALGSRRMPQLQLVGSPTVVSQFATFLGTVSTDGYIPRSFAHSQSHVVRLVSISGRRARDAIEALYGGDPPDALDRKLALARHACAWTPLVRGSYPWDQWLDGQPHLLARGLDYDTPRRLWESGRKAAAVRGIRLVLIDRGDSMELRGGTGVGTSWRRLRSDG